MSSVPRFPDLRAFLADLRRDRDLIEIQAPVSRHLEAAEIHRRVIAAGGPALLFTNVSDSDFPLVTNLFGTARRVERAFGRRPERLLRRLVETAEQLLPPTPAKLWAARDLAGAALRVGLRTVGSAPVTEITSADPRLDRLPALTCWREDGGPFLTLPLVYTEHPGRPDGPITGSGQPGSGHPGSGLPGSGLPGSGLPGSGHPGSGHPGHNLGMYRMQVYDRSTAGMHWQIGKGGGFHYAAAEERNLALPVTVFLGGPPALMLAAIAPLPENVPELMLASLVLGEKLARTKTSGPAGRTPHPLIASAEFALIGSVPPQVRRPEGPFGDHYGYYSLRHDYPVLQVSRMARRRDAIYPATVVGKPRQEDSFLGDFLQEMLSPLFPLVMPGVRALWSYGETGYHSLAAAVVRERYRREAMASTFRILGEGQLSLTKFLLALDRPVDLKDFRAVLTHLLERTRPESDLFVFANLSMDTLDYTGPKINEGSKGVWLGLGDPVRELPREFRSSQALPPEVTEVLVFSPGCLVVGGPPYASAPDFASRVAAHPAFADWPLLVVTDEPRRAAKSVTNFLWTTFTRFEPAADIHAAKKTLVRNQVAFTPPIAIDARTKPDFPAELFCDGDTAALVSRRWREYFPASAHPHGGVEMGDSGLGHLDPA